jgi:hypothetical protein
MSAIELLEPKYFRSGQEWDYEQVGNAYSAGKPVPSVIRYKFIAPKYGVNSIKIEFSKWYLETGSNISLRFFIGADSKSHIYADETFPYSGNLNLDDSGVYMIGTTKKLLAPGKTYYLWVFPAETTFGVYSWENVEYSLESFGAFGSGRIGIDAKQYLPTVGGKLYIPVICNGSIWKIQT